jgi:hypothetical protein
MKFQIFVFEVVKGKEVVSNIHLIIDRDDLLRRQTFYFIQLMIGRPKLNE